VTYTYTDTGLVGTAVTAANITDPWSALLPFPSNRKVVSDPPESWHPTRHDHKTTERKELSMTQHPETHLVDVVCASCGTAFAIRSTATSLSVDVCSNCHPAYTGVQHTAARGGRIERFNRRRALAA